MADNYIFILARFDGETEKRLQQIRQGLLDAGFKGRQAMDIPFHITLGSFDLDRKEDVTKRLGIARKNFTAFDIGLSSIGLFGLNVLYLAPVVNSRLLCLRECFLGSDYSGYEWVPHVTLLMDEPEEILRALPVVAGSFDGLTARVTNIDAYEYAPEEGKGRLRF